jgi:hypothetical protein
LSADIVIHDSDTLHRANIPSDTITAMKPASAMAGRHHQHEVRVHHD